VDIPVRVILVITVCSYGSLAAFKPPVDKSHGFAHVQGVFAYVGEENPKAWENGISQEFSTDSHPSTDSGFSE
jgi:hypothetical protein